MCLQNLQRPTGRSGIPEHRQTRASGECVHTPEPQLVPNSEEADVVKNYRLLDARGRDTVRRCIANQLQYSGKGE